MFSTPPPDGPESQVITLLERARVGDVDGYLAAFTGTIRQRLEREVAEQGRAAFAAALRQAAEAQQSHAVFTPEADGPDAARVTVESVYLDRNERQTFRLARTADGWRVAEVETVRAREPKARFGAPATFDGPEGVPVETARGQQGNKALQGQASEE